MDFTDHSDTAWATVRGTLNQIINLHQPPPFYLFMLLLALFFKRLTSSSGKLPCFDLLTVKYKPCKGQIMKSTPINSFIQSFFQIPNLEYLSETFFTKCQVSMKHNIRFTSYKDLMQAYTSNKRLTLPHLNQTANYDAAEHNSWQINNSL